MDSTTPFGALGRLPPELRLCIWGYLFSFGSTAPNQMALLRTSRSIYHEVSNSLYDIIDVSISPEDYDTVIMSPRKLQVSWNPVLRHAKRPKFERLPYRRIRLVVHLYPPTGAAELISLWQKVNDLVDILRRRHCFRSIDILFEQRQGQDWQRKGKAKETIRYPGSTRPDHDIVFMPFCYLRNVRTMAVIPSSPQMDDAVDWGFINYGRDYVLQNHKWNNRSSYFGDPAYVDLVRVFDNVESLILDTRFFLDTKLDGIPGQLANMLRLKRFATWFPDGDNHYDDSPYQHYILTLLRWYPDSAKTHDPGLHKLFARVRNLIWLHHPMANWDVARHRAWKSQAWYERFPDGVPEIIVVNIHGFRYVNNHETYSRNYRDSRRSVTLSLFCADARRWLVRQSRGFRGLSRVIRLSKLSTVNWCRDCCYTGFTYGCRLCRNRRRELPFWS